MVLNLRTVEEIFGDYSARRTAIVRALTTEVDHFYELCDPEKENLCFYGHPNESWEVTKPAKQILADVPEPAPGINYFRDLIREDFLSMVAIHSDSWLISVAFLLGAHAHLSRNQRNHLFSLINDLPTIYEVVTEEKPVQDKPSTDGGTSEGSNGTKRSIDGQMETDLNITDDTHEDAEDEHNATLCGSCGANNNPDEYWIACDVCQRWFHAMCATITPSTDESNRSIKEYQCPFCCIKAL